MACSFRGSGSPSYSLEIQWWYLRSHRDWTDKQTWASNQVRPWDMLLCWVLRGSCGLCIWHLDVLCNTCWHSFLGEVRQVRAILMAIRGQRHGASFRVWMKWVLGHFLFPSHITGSIFVEGSPIRPRCHRLVLSTILNMQIGILHRSTAYTLNPPRTVS